MQFGDLIKDAPRQSGIYMFYDAAGRLLYVGKAKDLAARLKQYTDNARLEPHKIGMVSETRRVDIKITPTEAEALLLEQDLIKGEKPKYNILMADDKMYPMLTLTKSEFPRLLKFRAKITGGRDVFGPYPSVAALHDAIKTLQQTTGLRTCSDAQMKNRARPCILHQIKRCSAPCCGKISKENYALDVKLARRTLSGDSANVAETIRERMNAASETQDYEAAATLRDRLKSLQTTAQMGKISERAEPAEAKFFAYKLKKWEEPAAALEKWLGIDLKRADVFDNSHLFGKNPVGAMIVFTKEGFAKGEYRHYKLEDKSVSGNDTGMMEEFLTRRYSRVQADHSAPSLTIVDGGRAQWNAAKKVLSRLGLDIPVLGVVKGEVRSGDEHFIMPSGAEEKIEKGTPLFLMLRAVRDEAHRFAITFHRRQRARSATSSVLSEIEGVGAARRRALLAHFGALSIIKDAPAGALAKVPGISKDMANKIFLFFHPDMIN
ncbi:MAG: excinuclease ABC subunit UvrC [Rickettsiales bacterium]|jgi:excinuclease ABC subunit C|nr:excinuclease ABC subunit UvrC [Rickettsiales bacterium]